MASSMSCPSQWPSERSSQETRVSEQDEVLYEVDGHVATITLNSPDRLNAITSKMLMQLG